MRFVASSRRSVCLRACFPERADGLLWPLSANSALSPMRLVREIARRALEQEWVDVALGEEKHLFAERRPAPEGAVRL